MKLIHACLISLVFLLIIVMCAQFWGPVDNAVGTPHAEHPGMMVSKTNIDQYAHSRWLGYLFGLGIIGVLGSLVLIGVRKKARSTSLTKYVYTGLITYLLVFSGMVISHWNYAANDGGTFFASMPAPTAWMIFGVWFVPLIITVAFILRFEDSVISDEEITEFKNYLASRPNHQS